MASKKCSITWCKHMHTTKWKLCPRCRARSRKNIRKRKRLAAEQTVPSGQRLCIGCSRIQPEDQFISSISRRKKPTTECQDCRDIAYRSSINPETLTGQCRQVWLDWKKDKTCAHCGCSDAIEADHLRGKRDVGSDYVHACSSYSWWACNGGPEALKEELAKCQPLCAPCHRIKSKKERNAWTRPCILRRRNIINDEKLRVGACECGCGRKVTPENVITFDWAHNDRSTKTIEISQLVKRSDEYFQKQWPLERAKCRLLHSICHKAETAEENKR
jgi:hypothetical protein